jgi:hypothetical protein
MPRPLASLVLAAASVAVVASAAWAAADLRRIATAVGQAGDRPDVTATVGVEMAAGAGAAISWKDSRP